MSCAGYESRTRLQQRCVLAVHYVLTAGHVSQLCAKGSALRAVNVVYCMGKQRRYYLTCCGSHAEDARSYMHALNSQFKQSWFKASVSVFVHMREMCCNIF
eukprot:jgi/Ulvmu1/7402/UM036_0062.1